MVGRTVHVFEKFVGMYVLVQADALTHLMVDEPSRQPLDSWMG